VRDDARNFARSLFPNLVGDDAGNLDENEFRYRKRSRLR
jgi:hypothetical protein